MYLSIGQSATSVLAKVENHSRCIVIMCILIHAALLSGLVVVRHYNFGAIWGEDTGYYNQIFWSTLNGEFFRGTLMQARYFNPPVVSEFQVHNSPIIMLIAPLYALLPSVYTLLVLRTIIISASAIPIYLLAKEMLSGVAGVILVVAYLLSTGILYQSIGGFYPIQFIVLFLPLAFLYFSRGDLKRFIIAFVLCLFVREEITLTVALFSLYAGITRRRWPWIVAPVVLSSLWWLISTKLVMTGSQIAMDDLDRFFKDLGGSYNEILLNVITHPWILFHSIVTKDHLAYLYAVLKPASGIAFGSTAIMFVLPNLAVNAIVGIFWKATLRPDMHYSVLISVTLFIAIIYGIQSLGRYWHYCAARPELLQLSLAVVLLPPAVIGVKDVFEVGGGRKTTLINDFVRKEFHDSLETIIAIVSRDPNASLAAPSILLPALSKRSNLYCADWIWRYNSPRLDYVILDVERLHKIKKTRNDEKYQLFVSQIRSSDQYQLIFAEKGFELYQARDASRLNVLELSNSGGSA